MVDLPGNFPQQYIDIKGFDHLFFSGYMLCLCDQVNSEIPVLCLFLCRTFSATFFILFFAIFILVYNERMWCGR